MPKRTGAGQPQDRLSFETCSFNELVKQDKELAALRREYARKSASTRQKAADWEYHANIANELFARAVAAIGQPGFNAPRWPDGVVALAIDPKFAPALLTVGSLEYQVGRVEAAMELFLQLTALPEGTQDLAVIIDKAGDFLLDQDDLENARNLYATAAAAWPQAGLYRNGLSYCLGKQGRLMEALAQARKAVELEPDNAHFLSDLGWSLVEVSEFDEAQTVLQKAVALAPPDYKLPVNNLAELKRRMAKPKRKNAKAR